MRGPLPCRPKSLPAPPKTENLRNSPAPPAARWVDTMHPPFTCKPLINILISSYKNNNQDQNICLHHFQYGNIPSTFWGA